MAAAIASATCRVKKGQGVRNQEGGIAGHLGNTPITRPHVVNGHVTPNLVVSSLGHRGVHLRPGGVNCIAHFFTVARSMQKHHVQQSWWIAFVVASAAVIRTSRMEAAAKGQQGIFNRCPVASVRRRHVGHACDRQGTQTEGSTNRGQARWWEADMGESINHRVATPFATNPRRIGRGSTWLTGRRHGARVAADRHRRRHLCPPFSGGAPSRQSAPWQKAARCARSGLPAN